MSEDGTQRLAIADFLSCIEVARSFSCFSSLDSLFHRFGDFLQERGIFCDTLR